MQDWGVSEGWRCLCVSLHHHHHCHAASESPSYSVHDLSQRYREEGELVWDKVGAFGCCVHNGCRKRPRAVRMWYSKHGS